MLAGKLSSRASWAFIFDGNEPLYQAYHVLISAEERDLVCSLDPIAQDERLLRQLIGDAQHGRLDVPIAGSKQSP